MRQKVVKLGVLWECFDQIQICEKINTKSAVKMSSCDKNKPKKLIVDFRREKTPRKKKRFKFHSINDCGRNRITTRGSRFETFKINFFSYWNIFSYVEVISKTGDLVNIEYCTRSVTLNENRKWRFNYLLSLEVGLNHFWQHASITLRNKLNKRYASVNKLFCHRTELSFTKEIDMNVSNIFHWKKTSSEITFYPASETKHCQCKSVNACRPIVNRRRILWGFSQLNMIHWLYHGKLRGVSKS